MRVTTIGHVPADVCVLDTVRLASAEQASDIISPNASSAAMVVTGAGAAEAEQPCTFVTGMIPVMAGAVSSTTVIVWDAVAEFPQSSVAVQVRMAVYSPGQVPGIVWSVNVSENELPQRSTAAAFWNTGVAGQ